MRWIRRVMFWLQRRRMADELREEMETHRALREDALARDGAADAAAQSRRAFGNFALAQDDARDVWIWPWLDGVVRDARYTLRSLARRPAFAVTCIATIAIGTGALASGTVGRQRGAAEPAAVSRITRASCRSARS